MILMCVIRTKRGKKMKKKTITLAIAVMIMASCFILYVKEPESPEKEFEPKNPPDFTLGLHIAAWTLIEYDWSGNPEDADWETNVIRNLDWISKTGYNTLLIDVMEPWHGTYFFRSDILKENGYNEYTDAMGLVVEKAHDHDITVFADTTVLAWRLDDYQTERYDIKGNKLSIEQVQKVIKTLLDEYDFDGIVEESYPLEYVEGIAQVVHERPGKVYIHKFDDPWNNADVFMSEDYVGFLSSSTHAKKVSKTGAAANTIGLFNALFGHAKAVGKPGWVKVTTDGYDLDEGASHNVMLLRAVQFNADGYFWMPSKENGRELLRNNAPIMDVNLLSYSLNRLRTPLEEKPVANFVVSLPFRKEEEYREASYLFMVHAFGPVSNGFMLSGYDIQTTYNEVLPDADAYVVFAIGTVEEVTVDVSDEVLDLLEKEQYKPVVCVVWGITDTGNWRKALSYLGVSNEGISIVEGSIDEVVYDGYTISWSPPVIWEYPVHTSVIGLKDVSGDVLVTGKKNGKDIALIIKNENRYLVNANALHLETSFIFDRLLNNTVHEPFYGYGVSGKRSAFLALKDTPLAVELPFEEGEEIRLTLFGSDGILQTDETVLYAAPLRTTLNQYELLIVEPRNISGEPFIRVMDTGIVGNWSIWILSTVEKLMTFMLEFCQSSIFSYPLWFSVISIWT